MLPRPNRLTSRQDFSRVYSKGQQLRSPLISLYAFYRSAPAQSGCAGVELSGDRPDNRIKGEPRFGYSVSKKVGGAVQRNRVKRRLREACRTLLESLHSPMDFVLVARQGALEADFGCLCGVVEQLVKRAVEEKSLCVSQVSRNRKGRRPRTSPQRTLTP